MEPMKTREAFIELRAAGQSFDKIAKALKLSKQTLVDWGKEYEEEIANLKAIELEALYEKYFLLKEKRIEAFGEILQRLGKELQARDLSDLPTDKLLDLMVKYHGLLKEDYTEPRFHTAAEIRETKSERATLAALTEAGEPEYGKLKIA